MSARYVYRVFDHTGDLIYIGSTDNVFKRLDFHKRNTWWADQAAHVYATVHPRDIAYDIERVEIRTEEPRWNVIGVWGGHVTWDRRRFADYLTAYLRFKERIALSDRNRVHIANVVAAYRSKFGEALDWEELA